MEYQTKIAFYAAALSTALAIFELWKFYRDRLRIEVENDFLGVDGESDYIIIDNPSPVSYIVRNYKLFWITKRSFRRSIIKEFELDIFRSFRISIEAFSTKYIDFTGQDINDITKRPNPKAKLYIILYIVGKRRAIKKFVY